MSKYNNDKNANTNILSNIFNNVTKRQYPSDSQFEKSNEPTSLLDEMTSNNNFNNIYEEEKTNVDVAFDFHKQEPIVENDLEKEEKEVTSVYEEEEKEVTSVYEEEEKVEVESKDNYEELKVQPTYNSSYREEMEKEVPVSNIEKHNVDIQSMFERINSNVKEATDIFNKNIEMRDQLTEDINGLKNERDQLISDKAVFERRINDEYQRLNSKKEQEEQKLEISRNELETQIEKLNQDSHKLEVERITFETRRNDEYQKFTEYKDNEESKIQEGRNEITSEKERLNSYRLDLEEEKRRMKMAQVRLDNERNELTMNLNKFNELVNNFNYGISKLPNEE